MDYETLITRAAEARSNAYAPYSEFRTGAAVLGSDGSVHVGALIENLVFGAAMCAERVALFSAVSAGAGRPQVLAVVAPETAGDRTFPCGSCLQVAIELGGPELIVVAASPEKSGFDTRTVDELAPGIPEGSGYCVESGPENP